MKRICIHWTAGTGFPSEFEKQHYHRLVDYRGDIYPGKKPPEVNLPKNGKYLTEADDYVAHCGGGNSFCIGWALCGMAGFVNPQKPGSNLLRKMQFEKACYGIARDCNLYHIPVTPETVFTHYEFGKANPNTPSRGKIDIIWLPFRPDIPANKVGAFFRSTVNWYLQKIKNVEDQARGRTAPTPDKP